MILPWEVWWGAAAVALGIAALMVSGVRRTRAVDALDWKGVALCVSAVLISTVLAGLSVWQSHKTIEFSRTLKNPSPPAHLPPDWGSNFNAEEKFKYSQMLAQTTFVDWGIHVNYFDIDGTFRQYQPTEEDRSHRESRLRFTERTTLSGALLFWSGLVWILVPWLGLAYAVTTLPNRISGTLTSRSKVDAPPSSGAPLS